MTNERTQDEASGEASQPLKPTASKPIALSASRANDFRQCPLLYRFRAIDRLPEPTTEAQFKGTVVHAVFEKLFGLPPAERNPDAAIGLLPETFEALRAEEDPTVVPAGEERRFLNDCAALVFNYYHVEDPRRFDPTGREQYIHTVLPDATPVRGFMDRLDVASTGEVRIVDYKTGKKPLPRYSGSVEFQMRLYSLMYWRVYGTVPDQMKLIYLKTGETIVSRPSAAELLDTERKVVRLWNDIRQCGATGEFIPRASKLCSWCAFQQYCPEFGGTLPDYPGWPGESHN